MDEVSFSPLLLNCRRPLLHFRSLSFCDPKQHFLSWLPCTHFNWMLCLSRSWWMYDSRAPFYMILMAFQFMTSTHTPEDRIRLFRIRKSLECASSFSVLTAFGLCRSLKCCMCQTRLFFCCSWLHTGSLLPVFSSVIPGQSPCLSCRMAFPLGIAEGHPLNAWAKRPFPMQGFLSSWNLCRSTDP